MRLILLGCPGAGKGTQAQFITQRYHIPQISTGEILRDAINKNNVLGKNVKAIMQAGHLVPDDLVIQLVKERINQADCESGFLLDGFPRTVAQATALHQFTSIDYVIDIDVPENEIIQRLSGRRIHPASGRIYHLLYHPPQVENKDDTTGEALIQRPDDTEETVRKRLAVYQAQTKPLQIYYQEFDNKFGMNIPTYVKIDGTASIEEIKNKIFFLLDKQQAVAQ